MPKLRGELGRDIPPGFEGQPRLAQGNPARRIEHERSDGEQMLRGLPSGFLR